MVDLGQLLRLKQMIDAVAGVAPNVTSASTLVDGYNKLRASVQETAVGLRLEEEFTSHFAPLDSPPTYDPGLAGRLAVRSAQSAEEAAVRASAMLQQLAGWVDGLVAERTLDARIKAEAEARVAAETTNPIGFRSGESP